MRSRLLISTLTPGAVAICSPLCLAHGVLFDATLVLRSLEDALHVDAGKVHLVGIDLADFDQVLDFGNRNLAGGADHWIEIARRLPQYQIAPFIALPCPDECELRGERALHYIAAAVELADLFAFGDNGAHP